MSRFFFGRQRRASPRFYLAMGIFWIALGVGYFVITPVQALLGSIWLAAGVLYLFFAAGRFVQLRKHPEAPMEGLTRLTRDGKRLTITGVEGDSVLCSRYDPKTGMTDAWVGSWPAYEALTRRDGALIGNVARDEPA